MKSLSPATPRLRRSLLLGFLLALGAAASPAQEPDRLRTTASTGIFTLVPRQTVRLHLVDVGRSTALSSRVRLELRDDRGTLIGSLRTPMTLRPGMPVHLVLRSTTLLGSRAFLYVRAIAIIETDLDNPESAPIFTVEAHPEAPGGLFLTTEVKCPLRSRDMDDPLPDGPVYNIDGDCEVVGEAIPTP